MYSSKKPYWPRRIFKAAQSVKASFGSFRLRAESVIANLLYQLQLGRLKLERWINPLVRRNGGYRVMATACWSFPIYSQTFVYQELTQLIRRGVNVRFIYSKLGSKKALPSQFSRLWRARRRLILHEAVCESSYDYFLKRMPEKIDSLVNMLCHASGLSRQDLRSHRHFRQSFAFARMVAAYQPHYLHSYFFYEGTLFSLVASHLLGMPRGVSCYSDHMLQDYELKVVPLHLRQCSLVVATSQHIKRELLGIERRLDQERVIVKPNSINTAQFPAIKCREPENGQPYRTVCVSRLEPKKGLIYLIEALGHLRARGINIELDLIGDVDDSESSREYAEKLRATIARLDLVGFVHLRGRCTESEIKTFFKNAHLFAAPFVETENGDKDGIPTALLEALASGLPIVATNAGSISEVIDDQEDGVIVPQRDADSLVTAIAQLLSDVDKRKRLGENAARKARERFDVGVCEYLFHNRLTEFLSKTVLVGELSRDDKVTGAPEVSVIIIFYNAERFIEEAIASVFDQTFENWELLLVDDGSSDASTEIARSLASRYPGRVKYIEHENHRNLGMSATRNIGLRHARGRYFAFLDADDVWLPDKLDKQLQILESEPRASMVFGATRYWYSWTQNPEDLKRDHIPDAGIPTDRLYEPPELAMLLYPLGQGSAPCPSDLLMRREVIERIGGFVEDFRHNNQLYEDQAFLAKLYLNEPVFVSSKCWAQYRIHPNSCMSKVTGAGQYESVRKFFLNWFQGYLQDHKKLDSKVDEALQEALKKISSPISSSNPRAVVHDSGTNNGGWDLDSQPQEITTNGEGVFGKLRQLTPISTVWGFDRGLPVDRYYIEKFLLANAEYIHGHVLEIGDDAYSRKFGGNRVKVADVLHVNKDNQRATIVADLTSADHIPANTFDCIVFTQTLHLIYDTRAVLRTVYRILKSGGALLATFPGITRISHVEWTASWFWGFTSASAQRLFEEVFPKENIVVAPYGNVLSAISFLHGLAAEELEKFELEHRDPDYEVLITVRAEKPESGL